MCRSTSYRGSRLYRGRTLVLRPTVNLLRGRQTLALFRSAKTPEGAGGVAGGVGAVEAVGDLVVGDLVVGDLVVGDLVVGERSRIR